MGITQVHDQLIAILLGPVTYSLDFQVLCKSFTKSHHHVVDQRTGQAVEGARIAVVILAFDQDLIFFDLDLDARKDLLGQGLITAADFYFLIQDLHLEILGYGNRFFTYSRHSSPPALKIVDSMNPFQSKAPLTKHKPALRRRPGCDVQTYPSSRLWRSR